MNPTSVAEFFRTTRDFDKYVVNQDRKLSKVAPFQIPIDYSPNSGNQLGILVEQASTNHFPDSENMVSGVQTSNVSILNKEVSGSIKSANFPKGSTNAYIGANVNINSPRVGISFYAIMSNLQRPTIGYLADAKTSLSIQLNGREFTPAGQYIDVQGPMNDLSYRVRVVLETKLPITNIKIVQSRNQLVGVNLSRIQIEPELCTSYIPTTGTKASRPAETVYRNLTHGLDFNKNQGTFDVLFTAAAGSSGSAMTLLYDDWSEYVALGHQRDETGEAEALRFHTSSTHIPVPLRHHHSGIRDRYTAVRFSYSGYGVRGVVHRTPYIAHLKAFDSFYNNKFNRMHFGESYDGTHFSGHIHLVNAYARTFNDEELLDMTYIPNDSSVDEDFDLEESGIFSTAAAIFRTDEEALLYQNVVKPPTPQRILAAWPRSSNHTYAENPQNATGNGKRWYFDPNRYSFVQPVNSNEKEQIFSPVKLSEFEFTATLTSNDGDDDIIGLVVAADIINGGLYSLMVSINCGGNARNRVPRRFAINLYTPSTGNQGFNLGRMVTGSDFLPKVGGWSGKRVKIKVIRQGTFVRALASTWNGDDYIPESELVCNMADLPGAAKNLGFQPARYGFMTNSQADSTYLDYNLKSNQVINELKIYSQESNKFWYYENGSWVLQTKTATEDILPSTRINNRLTNESFIIDDETGEVEFQKNIGIDYGTGNLSVPRNKTVDIPMSQLIDQFEYDENELFFMNIFNEVGLLAEQITLQNKQYVRIVSGNTDGTFVLLLGTESVTDSFGITNQIIGFRNIEVGVA